MHKAKAFFYVTAGVSLLISLSWPGAVTAELSPPVRSAQLVYEGAKVGLCSSPPSSSAQLKALAGILGLKSQGGLWTFEDEQGQVTISGNLESKYLFVHFYPATETRFSESALNALGTRAEAVELSGPNGLTFKVTSKGAQAADGSAGCGDYVEYVTVRFDGVWTDTACFIDWRP